MAISKPSWLRRALSYLNWDIFYWDVYVGDTIEDGIDWVVDWLNWAIKWAKDAWNKAVVAWDKAVEVGRNAWSDLCKETAKIWNKIDTWWSDLKEWWTTKVTWIKDLIDAAEDWLKERIDIVKKDLNTWVVKIGNFFTSILPGLATRKDVDKAIADDKITWKDLWDFWGSSGRGVIMFFTDPLEWLCQHFSDWFLGKEK